MEGASEFATPFGSIKKVFAYIRSDKEEIFIPKRGNFISHLLVQKKI